MIFEKAYENMGGVILESYYQHLHTMIIYEHKQFRVTKYRKPDKFFWTWEEVKHNLRFYADLEEWDGYVYGEILAEALAEAI